MLWGAVLGGAAWCLGTRAMAAETKPAAPGRDGPLTPVIASDWFRLVNYPDHHLNDFCLFQDRRGQWHAIGIMGTGTWKSEQSLFHCSGASLSSRFRIHPPVLAEVPAKGLPPQKHAPFVVYYEGFYHLFYRRPPGTILRVRSRRPDHWPGLGVEVFAQRDARDVCIIRIDETFHMYYCQSAEVKGELRSCIMLRRSQELEQWDTPLVVHSDTTRISEHSYLESPCVVRRPEGYYLFVRHRLMDARSTTVVFFSRRPDAFPSGKRAWFCELDGVHAPEIVEDRGRYFIARVSGPPHANKHAPARGGWIEVAGLTFR